MTFAHVFDIAAAFTLAFFVVRGAMRGFTGEIVSLFGLIASVLCGWTFARPLSGLVLNFFPGWNATVTELACAVVIFICVSLAFAVISKILRALVKAANLKFLDHSLGAVAGGARAFVIVLFIYGAMSIFPVLPGGWMADSLAMKCASAVWPSVYRIMVGNGWINPNQLPPVTDALSGY